MSVSELLRRRITLTRTEVEVFEREYIRKVQEYPSFALRCGQYLLRVQQRIMKIEQSCEMRRPGHLVLLLIGLDLDESSFDKVLAESHLWVYSVNFRQTGASFIGRYFLALKLLIEIPEAVLVNDEVKRYLIAVPSWHCESCGYEWKDRGEEICPRCESKGLNKLPLTAEQEKFAYDAAKRKVQRAKGLAVVLLAYFIRGFVKELTERAVPADASCWIRIK